MSDYSLEYKLQEIKLLKKTTNRLLISKFIVILLREKKDNSNLQNN